MIKREFPFYLKGTIVLFGLVLTIYILISLKSILIPVAFATIIAILLNPLVNWFRRLKCSNTIAISLSLFISIMVVLGILYFLSSQIAGFADNLPLLKSRLIVISEKFQQFLKLRFGISIQRQLQLVQEVLNSSKALIGSTLGTAFDTLSIIFLLPVYTFLILYYKSLILHFLYEVFSSKNAVKMHDILDETKTAIQSYMVGLLLEALIIAILNSSALLLLGIKYGILLGVIGALLNMIPYIGGIVAIALPLLMATVTKDGFSSHFGIIIAYLVIQFFDNNFLMPRIVSSKVQINALFSIIIVLLGGAMWGVSGMFLSIPCVAILKIIFDRVDELKPWGKLLGNDLPKTKMVRPAVLQKADPITPDQ